MPLKLNSFFFRYEHLTSNLRQNVNEAVQNLLTNFDEELFREEAATNKERSKPRKQHDHPFSSDEESSFGESSLGQVLKTMT